MLTPSFSALQSPQTPNVVSLEDTSTGSDGSITSRRAYVTNSDGEYLVPSGVATDYNVWPLAETTKSFELLTQDTAASIRVDWVDVDGVVLYSSTQQFCFAENSKAFAYYLSQQCAQTPKIVQSANFYANLCAFWADLRGAINAVETGDDIDDSQECLNRCIEKQTNESLYFV